MPALIYSRVTSSSCTYANGGLFALYFDFGKGLYRAAPSCWIVLARPFGFLTLFRLFRLIVRKI